MSNKTNLLTLPIHCVVSNDGQIEGLPKNPRLIRDDKFESLKRSIEEDPEMLSLRPVMVYPYNGEYIAIGGNMRLSAMKELGYTDVPCVLIPEDTPVDKLRAYVLKDNYGYGEWNQELLHDEWLEDLEELDMSDVAMFDIEDDMVEENIPSISTDKKVGSLKDRFIIPPFSVIDTRRAEWQIRKRMWVGLGIKSEVGRGEDLTYNKGFQTPAFFDVKNDMIAHSDRRPTEEEVLEECQKRGVNLLKSTSIFDPVLTEISYRWFCPENGSILDPFSGGSVRGIVAGNLGYCYIGNDLRREQVDANYDNAKEMDNKLMVSPVWTCGDSCDIVEIMKGNGIVGETFDMIFSCPPYADLEVYSDDPHDISNMDYDGFLSAYRKIIAESCSLLKENRFAVFVVGEVRNKKNGFYRNFVADTISAFIDAGLGYYNKMILVNSVGSHSMTAGNQFDKTRKISKVHQDILVFFKGDQRKIQEYFNPIDLREAIEAETKKEIDEINKYSADL